MYCVETKMMFETEADRASLKDLALDTSGKPTIAENKKHEHRIAEERKEGLCTLVRFKNENDMVEYFNKLKEKMKSEKVSKGSCIYMYECHHDKLPFRPCVIKEKFMVSEVSDVSKD